MSCDNCGSGRVATITAKCSDLFCFSYNDIDYDGYVPDDLGIADESGYGDYVEFSYCLECGKIQGEFPISDKRVKESISQRG